MSLSEGRKEGQKEVCVFEYETKVCVCKGVFVFTCNRCCFVESSLYQSLLFVLLLSNKTNILLILRFLLYVYMLLYVCWKSVDVYINLRN